MRLSTTDQAAVVVMLSSEPDGEKQSALGDLLKQSAVMHGLQCEECGSQAVGDNGARGVDLTFCCAECGHQWSPNI